MEFPINKFMTNVTKIPRATLAPRPSLQMCVCVVNDLVHIKFRNSIYKLVIEKIHTHTSEIV